MALSSILALGLASSTTISGCSRAIAAASPNTESAPTNSYLTVYKQDFALIQEVRPVDLAAGINHLRLDHVSRSLDPNSVIFSLPGEGKVVSSTYDLGVGSQSNVLGFLAGKKVDLIWDSSNGREGERIGGILEPGSDGGFLLRSGDKVYVNPKGTVVASADTDIDTLPGLSVQVQNRVAARENLRVSYLTRGMSWRADYTAHLDQKASSLKLECWASVTNETGIPFRDATVTFVAGQPNRAARDVAFENEQGRMLRKAALGPVSGDTLADAQATPAPESVGELYEYKGGSPATIGANQVSRVLMFEAGAVPVKLDYNLQLPSVSPWGYDSSASHIQAQLAINLENKKDATLGFPLPSGAVRVFESASGMDRYIGADTLADLPKDAPAALSLTNVFDVWGESSVISSQRIDRRTIRKHIRSVLHNAKGAALKLRVYTGVLPGVTWVSGAKPEKPDVSTHQWVVEIPAHGVTTIDATMDLRT